MKTLKDIQSAYKEAFALKQENYWVEQIIDKVTDLCKAGKIKEIFIFSPFILL